MKILIAISVILLLSFVMGYCIFCILRDLNYDKNRTPEEIEAIKQLKAIQQELKKIQKTFKL